ncbi:hypothetical protein [Halocalculus aciditolerans]|uniref:Uncharacterized protein n=1 Tax=Halocalculus aciditolerans TaxID=1383812 RepID=A0A830FND9_9EURY|nr:hypothetical protein [Halocalculus aciditolerans]GGL70181.1 hypothetical protein GCM10009039_30260 [Halocalculus aciditolerans]
MSDDIRELVEDLAAEVEELREETEDLREENAEIRDENEQLRERVDEQEQTIEALSARFEARSESTWSAVAELQSRELEKGAHLRYDNVSPFEYDLDVAEGRLERIEKDEGKFARLPGGDDPLGRGGETRLAHADLLPIQQLAQMDDDMLRGQVGSLPCRLAAKAWRERREDNWGLWSDGSGDIDQWADASDLKSWIRREESGISDEYAKKLVSRTIDALLDLSKNRLGVTKRTHRKDGLRYKERRIVLKSDVSIPGETPEQEDAPETGVVHG